ncbi:DUF192 domain-containing protein [Sphingomonas montanisoli]|uniref:DUF192 domain-containing protein n=1 Tax=Sphingomonas montanisoli TaxID=2606412 RepID=A0A5D9C898_9SPHN|nr:DUF192 domain-containing protein [Sphingomonas montanisoli]TZG26241.1 DUF192 domain-containing protein [Sphingomonas montanisoli]
MLRFRLSLALACASLAACAPTATTAAKAPAMATAPLTIETAKGKLHYQVEVARSFDEQERGLMFRTSLPAQGGMIFPMVPNRVATFWMKNTLIQLDMIFIRADGTIARIATAQPETLDTVDSGEPVAAVLEIVGGGAAKAGIAEGDRVTWADPALRH